MDLLASITPNPLCNRLHARHLGRFNVGEDCPVFHDIFEFSQASAGGSIGTAVEINWQHVDVAVNWAGGLHHLKNSEASGFCYC
ncbi:hypothetical protein L6452_42133 [Arctium lappa]|uniref:Uncharacterized protein n=1 Tax=Arctium lappa TaxID=4217 RepID=A0ACB8XHE9_ARCLA|nr:hypothetical protein L6452_42133 [Arctium lappa]